MNGHGNPAMVTVLYKIVNSDSDANGGLYNAFQMPRRGNGLTLLSVKQHCRALHSLNHIGPDGFHWRVCVEEKPPAGSSKETPPMFSWWDIQDENARLPVKETSLSTAEKMFMPQKGTSSGPTSTADSATKAAKGAFKNLGKAMSAVSGAVDTATDSGPRVSLIAFKLLDLVKMSDDFVLKHGGEKGHHVPQQQQHAPARPASRPSTSSRSAPSRPATARTPPTSAPAQPKAAATAARTPAQPQARPRPTTTPATAPHPRPQAPSENLMGFDSPKAQRGVHPAGGAAPSFPNETRAERLKREYAAKQQKANRVWDDVDQRWVEVDTKAGVKQGTTSAPPTSSAQSQKKKAVGIKLDPANAAGKSAAVQAAVHQRVNEMQQSQQKAVAEVREREAKKKIEEAEEDAVRKRLEPKIKAWSEEHGKKKQLRALLASLHTILWPEANWKQLNLGDILDDSKCKKAYHKASRVVHPDKIGNLSAENRFLAKRIFDALSQAKTNFDNGAK